MFIYCVVSAETLFIVLMLEVSMNLRIEMISEYFSTPIKKIIFYRHLHRSDFYVKITLFNILESHGLKNMFQDDVMKSLPNALLL